MKSNIAWDGIIISVFFDKDWGDEPFKVLCNHATPNGEIDLLYDSNYSDKESVISTVEELIKYYEKRNFCGGGCMLCLNTVNLGIDQFKTELRNKNFEKRWRQPNKLEKVFLTWLHS